MEQRELRPPGRPGWVVWLGVAVAVLVVLAIVMMLLMPGEHGPGRHM